MLWLGHVKTAKAGCLKGITQIYSAVTFLVAPGLPRCVCPIAEGVDCALQSLNLELQRAKHLLISGARSSAHFLFALSSGWLERNIVQR